MTTKRTEQSASRKPRQPPLPPLGSVVTAERIISYAFILLLVPGQIAAAAGGDDGFSFGMFWSLGANAVIGIALFARMSYPDGDLSTSSFAAGSAEQQRRRAIFRSIYIDLAIVVLGQIIVFNIIAAIGAHTFPSFDPAIWGELYGVTAFGVAIGLGFLGVLVGSLVISPIIRSFGPRADPRGRAMGIAFAVFLLCAVGMACAIVVGSSDSSGLTSVGLSLYRAMVVLTGIPDSHIMVTSPALAWVARLLFLPTVISGAIAVHASRVVWAASNPGHKAGS